MAGWNSHDEFSSVVVSIDESCSFHQVPHCMVMFWVKDKIIDRQYYRV